MADIKQEVSLSLGKRWQAEAQHKQKLCDLVQTLRDEGLALR